MSFMAFLKKEIMEMLKTPKALILAAAFIFFGILSPLTAKYMNEILKMAGQQQGVVIQLPPPTFLQSYEQFFKNINFMMVIIIILIFGGSVAEEKSRGTAVLVLTKCLSRQAFIIGKTVTAILAFTITFLVSAGICIYYTCLLFPGFMNEGVPYALFFYWLYGCLIIILTIFVSILSKSMTIASVSGFACFALISAVSAIPYIGKYTPGILQVYTTELVNGTKLPGDILTPVLITIVLCVVVLIAGIGFFKRQEI